MKFKHYWWIKTLHLWGVRAFNQKIDYVAQVRGILNPEGILWWFYWILKRKNTGTIKLNGSFIGSTVSWLRFVLRKDKICRGRSGISFGYLKILHMGDHSISRHVRIEAPIQKNIEGEEKEDEKTQEVWWCGCGRFGDVASGIQAMSQTDRQTNGNGNLLTESV